MNKELKEKWLTALRSGKYNQGRGRLYSIADNSYCCLGVLCKIQNIKITSGLPYQEHFDEKQIPSSELIRMNDSGKKTFFEIANYIEKNL